MRGGRSAERLSLRGSPCLSRSHTPFSHAATADRATSSQPRARGLTGGDGVATRGSRPRGRAPAAARNGAAPKCRGVWRDEVWAEKVSSTVASNMAPHCRIAPRRRASGAGSPALRTPRDLTGAAPLDRRGATHEVAHELLHVHSDRDGTTDMAAEPALTARTRSRSRGAGAAAAATATALLTVSRAAPRSYS